jgi:hypothetical protein
MAMDSAEKRKRLSVGLQVAAWVILFCLPIFVQLINKQSLEEIIGLIRYTWISPVALIIFFYANYYSFVDKFLFKRRILFFSLANAGLIILLIGLLYLYFLFLDVSLFKLFPDPGSEFLFFTMLIVLFLFFGGISVALKVTQRLYRSEEEKKELERQKSVSELLWLKSQLNPHFLFNTLNNIYSLVSVCPDDARSSISQLSDMLRYVLYDSSEELVSLNDEISFVRNYVKLMEIRLTRRTEVTLDLPEEPQNILVAPLLLISPVENAFKHGVSGSKPSFIHISLTQSEGSIHFTVENSYFPKENNDKSDSGIGLGNLKKRLELTYPGKYELTYGQTGDKYSLDLTLKTQTP